MTEKSEVKDKLSMTEDVKDKLSVEEIKEDLTREEVKEEQRREEEKDVILMGDSVLSNGDVHNTHPIFSQDPGELMQYIYKEVCVTMEDGETHTGRMYTIDPVSQCAVLVKFIEGEATNLKVLMGHAIESMTILDDNTEAYKAKLDSMFKVDNGTSTLTPEEMSEKRDKLKSWLLKNRIPVTVSGDNSEVLGISDALFIEPPYGPDQCRSTNEIILGRVQGLIKNMPKDVQDW